MVLEVDIVKHSAVQAQENQTMIQAIVTHLPYTASLATIVFHVGSCAMGRPRALMSRDNWIALGESIKSRSDTIYRFVRNYDCVAPAATMQWTDDEEQEVRRWLHQDASCTTLPSLEFQTTNVPAEYSSWQKQF